MTINRTDFFSQIASASSATISEDWLEMLKNRGVPEKCVDDLINRIAENNRVIVTQTGALYDLQGSWNQLKEALDTLDDEAVKLVEAYKCKCEDDQHATDIVATVWETCNDQAEIETAPKGLEKHKEQGRRFDDRDGEAADCQTPSGEIAGEKNESFEESDDSPVKTTGKRRRQLKSTAEIVHPVETDSRYDEKASCKERPPNRETEHETTILLPEEIHAYIMQHRISEIQQLVTTNCISYVDSPGDQGTVKYTLKNNDESNLDAITQRFKLLYSHLKTEVYHVPADVDWDTIEVIAAATEATIASLVCNKTCRTCKMTGPGSSAQHLKKWFKMTLEANLKRTIEHSSEDLSREVENEAKPLQRDIIQGGPPEQTLVASVSSSNFIKDVKESSKNMLEFITTAGLKVFVYKGDMVKQNTEVIVNSANSQLLHAGGLAKAIATVAGQQLLDECQTIISKTGTVSLGEAVYTNGGNLPHPIKYVIHVVGPNEYQLKNSPDISIRAMCKAFYNCLLLANNELRVTSISIPPIGTGN